MYEFRCNIHKLLCSNYKDCFKFYGNGALKSTGKILYLLVDIFCEVWKKYFPSLFTCILCPLYF